MFMHIKTGQVLSILRENSKIQILELKIDGEKCLAINYPNLIGRVKANNIVQVNTVAEDLRLGTGGFHFVFAIWRKDLFSSSEQGHIIKLRYTPQQIRLLAVEEEDSPYHHLIRDFQNLSHKPVLIGSLHSMLIPAIAGIRSINPQLKISYIMTDGGALPIYFSKNVQMLEEAKWLNGTITIGHAFGGDLEAINIYSGLATAALVQEADLIVVVMGPGIVGTATNLGTTALEVGQIINAVSSLGGRPIVIPRISFNDQRKRHQGISHHTITVLKRIALAKATVVFPYLKDIRKAVLLKKQIKQNDLESKHKLVFEKGDAGLRILQQMKWSIKTMGKSLRDEEEFFLAAAAAGVYAAKLF